MNQSELEELRHRLLGVLRERLAEAEDDEARQTNWEATNWDIIPKVKCDHCGKEAFRILEGRCLTCLKNDQERVYQLARRLSLVQKRYPKLTRGLARKGGGGKGIA